MRALDARTGRPWPRLIAVVASFAFLVTACTGGEGGTQVSLPPVEPTTPPAQGDVDVVVWNLPTGEPISLDPLLAYNYSENTVLGNACEALMTVAPDFAIEPLLAETVTRVSPTVWEYTLRDGVTFWNGNPLTADDVVYSIERHLDPSNGSYYLEPFAVAIESVEAVEPLTVRIVTSEPSVMVNQMLATGLGTVGEKAYIEQAGKSYGTPEGGLMCTGPFEFDSWSAGESLRLVRSEGYWDEARTARTAALEFRFVTDQALLTNALISGEIDGSYEAPAASITQLLNADGSFFLGPAMNNVALLPTARGIEGPLQDLRIRQALSLAIDRAGVAQTTYTGAAEPLKSTLILPITYPFEDERFAEAYAAMPSVAQDLEEAKRLASEADVDEVGPIVLAIQAEDPRSTQTANAIADAAGQIGLTIELQQVPAADFENLFFAPKAREAFDLILADNFGDFADPLEFLAFAALPGPQNFTNYDNPVVTDLYHQAQDTGDDQAARADLTIEAVLAFQADLQIIPVLYTPERLFMGGGLTGARATFPYQYSSWAADLGTSG